MATGTIKSPVAPSNFAKLQLWRTSFQSSCLTAEARGHVLCFLSVRDRLSRSALPTPEVRYPRFVFLPLDGGRELTTNWETNQQTLAHVKYCSESISTVYLEGALSRAFSRCPEVLGRRVQRAEQEEALATAAAAAHEHEQAAAAAKLAAERARHDRRNAEAQLFAERGAAACAAAALQAKAAAAARSEAAAAERRRRESLRRSAASTSVAHSAFASHRRRGGGGART